MGGPSEGNFSLEPLSPMRFSFSLRGGIYSYLSYLRGWWYHWPSSSSSSFSHPSLHSTHDVSPPLSLPPFALPRIFLSPLSRRSPSDIIMTKEKKPRPVFRKEEDDCISRWLSKEENRRIYNENKSAASRIVAGLLNSSGASGSGLARTEESIRKRMMYLYACSSRKFQFFFCCLRTYVRTYV